MAFNSTSSRRSVKGAVCRSRPQTTSCEMKLSVLRRRGPSIRISIRLKTLQRMTKVQYGICTVCRLRCAVLGILSVNHDWGLVGSSLAPFTQVLNFAGFSVPHCCLIFSLKTKNSIFCMPSFHAFGKCS